MGDFGWCGEEGGSGRYAAPEAAEATAEGDVFSLGLTVAEVALGERADDGETWRELRGGRLPHALRAGGAIGVGGVGGWGALGGVG